VVQCDSYSASNSISRGHDENQDSLLSDPAGAIFAVADGVGGYRGAKEASQLAIDTLRAKASSITDAASMKAVLEQIHDNVRSRARKLHYANMGTTIAVAKVLVGDKLVTGNVGDSPILLMPSGEDSFKYIFTDDSHRDSDPGSMWGITQYIGLEMKLDFHAREVACFPGDMILICSDGVTDNLLNPGVRQRMRLAEIARQFKSARKIVEEALNAMVKRDDMTVVLITI
jgi:PPM family protein phosphatase